VGAVAMEADHWPGGDEERKESGLEVSVWSM
jgi:hypothetical protein